MRLGGGNMLILIGKSGSGKSTIEKELCEKYGYKKIVSYTTRKPRKGEIVGVDYHFISDYMFEHGLECNNFAEHTKYNGNYYGIRRIDCKNDRIVVVEPNGLKQLMANKDLNITSIYLDVHWLTRLKRMLQRGDSFISAIKRIWNDRQAFKGVKDIVTIQLRNEGNSEHFINALKMMKVIK
jgi:guanylate kinase